MEIAGATWFAKLRKFINSSSSSFEWVGLVAMAAMALTTLIDVIGSKVFKWPLPGSTEITSVVQVIAIAGGLAFSKIDGRHIRVEFLIDWLPQRGKAVLDVFSDLLGLGLFVMAGWMTYKYGLSISNTKTFLLGIPLYPFAFWIACGCIPMCFVIFIELVASIERVLK